MSRTVENLPFTRETITCYANDNLKIVIQKLKENNVGALAVINDQKKIVGIISERDIIKKVLLEKTEDFTSLLVQDFMTERPKTVKVSDEIKLPLVYMRLGRFRHLIVEDGNLKVEGMISVKDCFDFLIDELNN